MFGEQFFKEELGEHWSYICFLGIADPMNFFSTTVLAFFNWSGLPNEPVLLLLGLAYKRAPREDKGLSLAF